MGPQDSTRSDTVAHGELWVELADLLRPGVTVVAQDPRRIGALAAELALSPGVAEDGVHLVPTRLIERGSGEIPAPIR